MRFRAARRGFKEVDLIFGTFVAEHLDALPETDLDAFEALLDAPDQDVYAWLRGHSEVPDRFNTSVFMKLKALCARKNPTWNA